MTETASQIATLKPEDFSGTNNCGFTPCKVTIRTSTGHLLGANQTESLQSQLIH